MKTKILLLACIACSNILFAQNPLLLKQATSGGTATVSQVVNTKTGFAFYNTVDNANPFSGTWGLWHTDGSVAGTKKITLSDGRYITTEATLLTALDSNRILFAGDNTTGYGEVWVSDGTQQGTFGLQNFLVGSGTPVQSIGAIGNLGIYAAVSNDGRLRLHATTATAYADTAVIYTFPAAIASVLYFKTINGILYFEANNSSTLHNEVWRTDGTTTGTYLLKDLGMDYGFTSDFMAFDNNIYFITISSSFGDYIWKSDGTTAGTAKLKQISTSFNQDNLFPSYAATSTALYFAANDGINGKEIWTTDGTSAGTHILEDLSAGSSGSNPSSFTVLNNVLYLSANNGIAGQELFKYDNASSSNVTLVKDIYAGSTGSNPSSIAVNNNSIIFNATQNTTDGAELWVSGGDAANTLQVDNIAKAASQSSSPKLITNGTLNFFVGNYDFNGDLITNEQAVFVYTPPNKIWTGNVSGDASVAANWFPEGAPANTDDVIVSASSANNLTNPFLFCHSFYNNGGTVDVGTGLCLLSGDLFNNGTINNPYINGFANGVFGIVTDGTTKTHLVGSSGIYNGQLTVSSNANLRLTAGSYFPTLRFEGPDLVYLGDYNLQSDGFSLNLGMKAVTDGSGKFLLPVGNSNVVFNVGTDSASSSPVTISNSGDYDYFGVNVKNGVFSKGNSGAVITQEAVNKTWDVSEALFGGSDATITFQWNAKDELPLFNRNNIYVSHYTNGNWDNGLVTVAAGNDPYTAMRTGITSFSPFSIASSPTILPLQLINFFAGFSNNNVLLSWQTQDEINTAHFNIQRSIDGVHFNTIETITAKGNSTTTQNYTYTDAGIIKLLNVETVYYRLEIMDKDGKSNLSKVASVTINATVVAARVFPNPANSNATILFNTTTAGKYTIELMNLSGKKLQQLNGETIAGENKININISNYAKGIYFVKLTCDEHGTTTFKLNKN